MNEIERNKQGSRFTIESQLSSVAKVLASRTGSLEQIHCMLKTSTKKVFLLIAKACRHVKIDWPP